MRTAKARGMREAPWQARPVEAQAAGVVFRCGRVAAIAWRALALGLILSASRADAAPKPAQEPTPMKKLGERDNDSEAQVHPGERLEIALEENRSTGYRWRVISDGSPVLRLESDSARGTVAPRPGAPGRHVWIFRVAATGEAALELAYARDWEASEPARRFTLRLKSSSP